MGGGVHSKADGNERRGVGVGHASRTMSTGKTTTQSFQNEGETFPQEKTVKKTMARLPGSLEDVVDHRGSVVAGKLIDAEVPVGIGGNGRQSHVLYVTPEPGLPPHRKQCLFRRHILFAHARRTGRSHGGVGNKRGDVRSRWAGKER